MNRPLSEFSYLGSADTSDTITVNRNCSAVRRSDLHPDRITFLISKLDTAWITFILNNKRRCFKNMGSIKYYCNLFRNFETPGIKIILIEKLDNRMCIPAMTGDKIGVVSRDTRRRNFSPCRLLNDVSTVVTVSSF